MSATKDLLLDDLQATLLDETVGNRLHCPNGKRALGIVQVIVVEHVLPGEHCWYLKEKHVSDGMATYGDEHRQRGVTGDGHGAHTPRKTRVLAQCMHGLRWPPQERNGTVPVGRPCPADPL